MAYFLKGTIEIGKGLALGRLTTAEIAAFVPTAPGMVVYDTDLLKPFQWDGVSWTELGSGGGIEDWATATDYVIGDTVFEENRIYRANADNTSTTFNADRADWDVLVTIPAGSAWTASTYYYADDIVVENNVLYRRIAGGTSGATFDSTEEVDWNVLGSTGVIANWASGVYYEIGEVVTINGTIYRTSTAHTSGGTFDDTEASNFTVLANYTDINTWSATTYYPAGSLVTQGTRIIKRTAAGTSAATFDNTEAALWTLVSNDTLSAWAASTYLYAGEMVVFGVRTLRRSGSGITGATFNSTEAAQYEVILPNPAILWVASTYFYQGELAIYAGKTLQKIANGVTTAAFDGTEAALWNVVTKSTATIWAATTYYYVGDIVLDNGVSYITTTAHVSGATFDAAEKLNFALYTGSPVTVVSGTYSVVETDLILEVTGAGPFTITIPAGRINNELHISRLHPNPVTAITIATSGGETIVNPVTGVAGASTTVPGIADTNAFIDYYKVGTVWQAA